MHVIVLLSGLIGITWSLDLPVLIPFQEVAPPETTFNYVIISSGYTTSEKDRYTQDVRTLIQDLKYPPLYNALIQSSPYYRYANFSNFYVVWQASQQSGASPPGPGKIDTNMDCKLPPGNQTGLRCDGTKAIAVAEYTPAAPSKVKRKVVIIVLVNVAQYGGTGTTWIDTNGDVKQIAYFSNYLLTDKKISNRFKELALFVHELSHAVGGLSDEYLTDSQDPKVDKITPNCIKSSDPTQVTWKHWFEDGRKAKVETSLATVTKTRNKYSVGNPVKQCAFPSYYKPTSTCIMLRLEDSVFCPICREQVSFMLTQTIGLSYVSLQCPSPNQLVMVSATNYQSARFALQKSLRKENDFTVTWTVSGPSSVTLVGCLEDDGSEDVQDCRRPAPQGTPLATGLYTVTAKVVHTPLWIVKDYDVTSSKYSQSTTFSFFVYDGDVALTVPGYSMVLKTDTCDTNSDLMRISTSQYAYNFQYRCSDGKTCTATDGVDVNVKPQPASPSPQGPVPPTPPPPPGVTQPMITPTPQTPVPRPPPARVTAAPKIITGFTMPPEETADKPGPTLIIVVSFVVVFCFGLWMFAIYKYRHQGQHLARPIFQTESTLVVKVLVNVITVSALFMVVFSIGFVAAGLVAYQNLGPFGSIILSACLCASSSTYILAFSGYWAAQQRSTKVLAVNGGVLLLALVGSILINDGIVTMNDTLGDEGSYFSRMFDELWISYVSDNPDYACQVELYLQCTGWTYPCDLPNSRSEECPKCPKAVGKPWDTCRSVLKDFIQNNYTVLLYGSMAITILTSFGLMFNVMLFFEIKWMKAQIKANNENKLKKLLKGREGSAIDALVLLRNLNSSDHAHLERQFKKFDIDNSGTLDRELKSFFHMTLCYQAREEELDLLFRVMDEDGDGTLSMAEFLALFRMFAQEDEKSKVSTALKWAAGDDTLAPFLSENETDEGLVGEKLKARVVDAFTEFNMLHYIPRSMREKRVLENAHNVRSPPSNTPRQKQQQPDHYMAREKEQSPDSEEIKVKMEEVVVVSPPAPLTLALMNFGSASSSLTTPDSTETAINERNKKSVPIDLDEDPFMKTFGSNKTLKQAEGGFKPNRTERLPEDEVGEGPVLLADDTDAVEMTELSMPEASLPHNCRPSIEL